MGESPDCVSFDEWLAPQAETWDGHHQQDARLPGMAATTLRLTIMASGSAPKHLRYFTISIWLGSFTSMYGPFSLRITTP